MMTDKTDEVVAVNSELEDMTLDLNCYPMIDGNKTVEMLHQLKSVVDKTAEV